jgi:hypothetical protein
MASDTIQGERTEERDAVPGFPDRLTPELHPGVSTERIRLDSEADGGPEPTPSEAHMERERPLEASDSSGKERGGQVEAVYHERDALGSGGGGSPPSDEPPREGHGRTQAGETEPESHDG